MTIMIQRYLLRQSRTIAPRLQILSRPSSSWSQYTPIRFPISSLPRRTAPRCYSTTADVKAAPDSEAPASGQQPPEDKEGDPATKDLESKNREIIDLKDRYLRSVADFRNLQDRTRRDIQAARDFAISRFATDLLESVDNLDRALSTVPPELLLQPSSSEAEQQQADGNSSSSSSSNDINGENESGVSADDENKELRNLYEGLQMTEAILMQTLKKHGLERFDPSEPGARFDPRLHEATFQTKVEGKEDGEVVMVQQTGFTLNGRVLRAAKVGVVKNS